MYPTQFRLAFGLGAVLFSRAAISSQAFDDFGSFNRKGLRAEIVYDCAIEKSWPGHSQGETDEFVKKLEAQHLSPEILKKMADVFRNGDRKTTNLLVQAVSEGDNVKFSRSGADLKEVGTTDYLNKDLICTALPYGSGYEYAMERSTYYASPNTLGFRFLPWYLGLLSLDRLYEGENSVVENGDQVLSRKFDMGQHRSVTIKTQYRPDGKVSKFLISYGISKEPSEVCTIEQWTIKGGYSIPSLVKAEMRNIWNNSIVQRITVKLTSASFKPGAKDDLQSLGPVGTQVTDCRLGEDNCVRYNLKEKPLTDAEVMDLLAKKIGKQAKHVAHPQNKQGFPMLAVLGVGLLALASVIWIGVRVAAHK